MIVLHLGVCKYPESWSSNAVSIVRIQFDDLFRHRAAFIFPLLVPTISLVPVFDIPAPVLGLAISVPPVPKIGIADPEIWISEFPPSAVEVFVPVLSFAPSSAE
jgi:hypothetical protein